MSHPHAELQYVLREFSAHQKRLRSSCEEALEEIRTVTLTLSDVEINVHLLTGRLF